MTTLNSNGFNISTCILYLIIISLSGCEYHTDKEFVNGVKQPDNANITIVLNPSDSVYYLGKYNTFVCEGFSDEVKVYNIKAYLDDSLVADKDGSRCVFDLQGSNYTEGHHVLTIVATTSAGSGSLADILNSEGFLFTYDWDLFVDHSPPTGAVEITDIYNDNGVLKIEWERYNNPNFYYYQLIKTVFKSSGYSYQEALPIILNRSQNYFLDESYLGGKVQYELKVVTPFDETVTSHPKIFIDDEIILNVEWIEEDLLRFSWQVLKYPKAFKVLSIYLDEKQLFYSNHVDTTSVTLRAGVIGKKSSISLLVESKSSYSYNHEYRYKITNYSFGLPMIKFNFFYKNNINKSVYVSTDYKLYRFETETRELVDSVTTNNYYDNFVLSPDNKILISGNTSKKYNPDHLNDQQDLDIFCNRIGSISNNSIGLASHENNYIQYDFLNLAVISSIPEITYGSDIFITEDSKFYLQAQNGSQRLGCYKVEDGLWTEKWMLPINDYSLIAGEPDKVLLLNNDVCEIRTIETNQVLKSFSVDASQIAGIDPTTKTVLLLMSNSSEESRIYNYQTGEMLRAFKVLRNSGLTYYRSAIYSTNGTIVPVNF